MHIVVIGFCGSAALSVVASGLFMPFAVLFAAWYVLDRCKPYEAPEDVLYFSLCLALLLFVPPFIATSGLEFRAWLSGYHGVPTDGWKQGWLVAGVGMSLVLAIDLWRAWNRWCRNRRAARTARGPGNGNAATSPA
jgi:uncharacterized membrane protein YjgN (DUF898 family)